MDMTHQNAGRSAGFHALLYTEHTNHKNDFKGEGDMVTSGERLETPRTWIDLVRSFPERWC